MHQYRPPQPPPANRRALLAVLGAIGIIAVIAIVLVIVLSNGPSSPTTGGGSIGPVAGGPQEPHGRRPITQVEPTSGRTLAVAQDGSGQFDSIQAAADQAQPGDTVVISAGTYSEPLVVNRDGAQGAYITFHAAPGADVVIQGDTDADGLVELEGRSWIKFVGIAIRGSSNHGLYAVDSNHIVLQDSEVADTLDGGAVFIDGSDIQVLHSEIRGTNAGDSEANNEAVSFSNIDGFEIAYSVVENCGEEGIDAKYEARNGKIHDNTTRGNNGPNIYVDAANTIDVYNNTVTGASGEGKAGLSLGVEDVSETRRTYAIKVYNNVISGNAGGGISFFVESEGTFNDIMIVNNTVIDNPGDGINPKDYTFAGANVLRNNIFSGNARDRSGQIGGFTVDHNLFASGAFGTAAVEGTVKFVNVESGDLRLAEGSAGIDAGVSDGAPQADILGVGRPGGKVDLGAFEAAAAEAGP